MTMEPLNIYSDLRNFVRQHILWILGAAPFALAAIKVLTASGADPEVFGYLVQQLDVIGLVLSVALPLIPLTVFWVWVMWFDRRIKLPKADRPQLEEWTYVIMSFVVIMVTFMQLGYVATSLLVLAITLYQRWRVPKKNEKLKLKYGVDYPHLWRYGSVNAISFLIVIAVQSILTLNIHWLPTEEITIQSQEKQQARVVSATEVFVTFINDQSRITIVRTKDVLNRQPCYANPSRISPTKSLSAVIIGDRLSKGQLKCPDRRTISD